MKDNVVEIEGIDALDKSPVLDLKPFIPGYDMPRSATAMPAWAER